MVNKEKISRINELSRKAKCDGLTPEEQAEQKLLREEYLQNFREHFKGQLDNIKFVEDLETENTDKSNS